MLRTTFFVIALLIPAFSQFASAGIALNSTRVIIENGKKEASLEVRNMGSDILVQSWLDEDSESDVSKHFTLTPQLVRVKAYSEQIIRVLYEGVGAPTDRETMLWLNVQEIPQRQIDDTSIQLAVLQRIKVFYRPQGLPGNLIDAIRNLEWTYTNGRIQISNPSAYHVTLVALTAHGKQLENTLVVGPGQHYMLDVSSAKALTPQSSITYIAVTDHGAQEPYRVSLNGERPAKGSSTANEE